MKGRPKLSVIIPTLNASRFLSALLSALKSQTVECEVIVIDSSSSDDTITIAESFGAKVIRINRADFDHGGTRNIGARQATGGIIVFLTQDALPAESTCLEALTGPLDDPKVVASFGRQLPKAEASPVERFARGFNYPDATVVKGEDDIGRLGIKAFFLSNVCSAFRVKEFWEAGGFPERTILNEDLILAARLILKGYKTAYAGRARVFHSHNYTLAQQMRRYFDIGVSFCDNPWILEHARADKEGMRFLKEQMRFLYEKGGLIWMPYAAGEAVFKLLGYKTGLHYKLIPNAIRKMLSMHRYHWD